MIYVVRENWTLEERYLFIKTLYRREKYYLLVLQETQGFNRRKYSLYWTARKV